MNLGDSGLVHVQLAHQSHPNCIVHGDIEHERLIRVAPRRTSISLTVVGSAVNARTTTSRAVYAATGVTSPSLARTWTASLST